MARSFSYREMVLTIRAGTRRPTTSGAGFCIAPRIALFAVLLLTTVAGLPYAPPAPSSQTPQLPTVPPNREIREGDIPTRR